MNVKEHNITNGFLELINIPKQGIVLILNEEAKKVFVTYSYNTSVFLTRMTERKRNKDFSLDILKDLDSRNAKILILDIETEKENNTKAIHDILRHTTNLKIDEYTNLGYSFYDNQYQPTKFSIKVVLDVRYQYVITLNTLRRKSMVVKSFKDPNLAKDFVNNTSILEMIRIHYSR